MPDLRLHHPHPDVGALAGPRVSAALAGILPDPAPGMIACRPPFPPMHTPEQSAAIHAAIRAARPDVLWVGRTAPRHFGAEIHGFLAYVMKCVVVGKPYRVIGYLGKHVRDNIHCADLVEAFRRFHEAPRRGKAYNMGGSRFSNCSMKEAVRQCEAIAGRRLEATYVEDNRVGDHIWWISDISKFQGHYPGWRLTRDVPAILREIHDHNAERWLAEARR